VTIPNRLVECFDGAGGIALTAHVEKTRTAADAGIDEGDVESTEAFDDARDGASHFFLAGGVSDERKDLRGEARTAQRRVPIRRLRGR